ncbi:MAG: class I SAM-dependent methyltransferase [Actinobacteria bacterium]|nr:class I SAM-dependent methyltransferase [Actinomycetota bacterium]
MVAQTSAPWKSAYGDEEVEEVGCPVCGARESSTVAVEWSLVVARCRSCGMQYVRRRIVHAEWNYRGDRDTLLAKYDPVLRGELPHTRVRNYAEILDRLEPYRPSGGGRLLDVGTHMGFFARAAVERGWELVGVEQSPVLAEIARSRGLDVRSGYFGEVDVGGGFDAVTFLDVLEHVQDPVALLGLARAALRPGGVVLVKVPHVAWNTLKHRTAKRLLGERMDSYDAREHLLQFTDATLRDTFRRAELEPLELFVPLPVQTGGRARRMLRRAAWAAGQASLRAKGSATALCPDLVLIGRRAP